MRALKYKNSSASETAQNTIVMGQKPPQQKFSANCISIKPSKEKQNTGKQVYVAGYFSNTFTAMQIRTRVQKDAEEFASKENAMPVVFP